VFPEKFSQLRIRTATNYDCESVTRLVFDVLAEFNLRGDPETTDADLKDIEANYLRRGGLFEIIEDSEGNLLGSFGLYPIDQNTCELRKMYFIPSVRGSGLGKYVLDLLLLRARELGFVRIVLETSSKLVAANRLYQQVGFKPATSDHLASRADQFYQLDL
jgi:putative acetyltransferase